MYVPSGNVLCAAEMPYMSYVSPFAVFLPWKSLPYHDETPVSRYICPGTGVGEGDGVFSNSAVVGLAGEAFPAHDADRTAIARTTPNLRTCVRGRAKMNCGLPSILRRRLFLCRLGLSNGRFLS